MSQEAGRLAPRRRGFDAAARDYDATFSATLLGRWLREAVREQLGAAFQSGQSVLDLGCGTGEDALWLAQRGVQVTATDGSGTMLDVACRKVRAAGVEARIDLQRLDLAGLETWLVDRRFDGAFSSFGALNCLADRRPIARALHGSMPAGGRVVLVIMGPLCPWEIGWHLLHGQPRVAFRRLRSGLQAHAGGGGYLPVWYPSSRRVRREFSPFFRCRAQLGLGVLLPPTYLGHLVERHRDLFGRLAAWERRHSHLLPLAWFSDHYVLVLERCGDGRGRT